jgi:hypothetical protein
LKTDNTGLVSPKWVSVSNGIWPTSAKSASALCGLPSKEWNNIYYVTANTGTSRIINSVKDCPVCSTPMKKGTGSINFLGEDADYEIVFCISCGALAVEERNQHTEAMLASRKPPPVVIFRGIRTEMMGGHDYKIMVDFQYEYGNAEDVLCNSTRLGDDELEQLKGMNLAERKIFLLALGEREWYAREEQRLMQEHVVEIDAGHQSLVTQFLNTDLLQ